VKFIRKKTTKRILWVTATTLYISWTGYRIYTLKRTFPAQAFQGEATTMIKNHVKESTHVNTLEFTMIYNLLSKSINIKKFQYINPFLGRILDGIK